MANKRYSDGDALKILREIDVHLYDGLHGVGGCRKVRVFDKPTRLTKEGCGRRSPGTPGCRRP